MNIVQHIVQLLYRHDCVIVPELGGFIANYQKAQIDFRGEIIRPPARHVIFNPKLKSNDGLLINHIVEQEHLDYAQVTELVQVFVHDFQKDLERRTWVELKDIGQFIINLEGNLEFKPSEYNFLLDSFGLPVVRCAPILRQKTATYTGTNGTQQQMRSLPKRKKRAFPAWVMGGAAAIALLIVIPMTYKALNGDTNTINSGTNTQQVIASNSDDNNNSTETIATIEENTGTASTTETPQTASIFSLGGGNEEPTTPVVEENVIDEEPVIEEPLVDIPDNAKTYIIVVGAFSKSSNAKKLIRQLERDGYFPDLTETSQGLQRVGVQMTCAPEDLDTHLDEIRKKFNKKAWILGN